MFFKFCFDEYPSSIISCIDFDMMCFWFVKCCKTQMFLKINVVEKMNQFCLFITIVNYFETNTCQHKKCLILMAQKML